MPDLNQVQHVISKKFMYILFWLIVIAHTKEEPNGILHRSKRFYVFPMQGGFKIVIGIGIPIKLGLKQSLSCGVNWQFQYGLATNITQLKIYPPIIGKSRERRDIDTLSDRTLFYLGVESTLDSFGINGRECVLRSICDSSMHTLHHQANGLYGKLLHIALTPLYGNETSNIDSMYTDAQRAGEFGVDCISLYPRCPLGSGVLDLISILDN